MKRRTSSMDSAQSTLQFLGYKVEKIVFHKILHETDELDTEVSEVQAFSIAPKDPVPTVVEIKRV